MIKYRATRALITAPTDDVTTLAAIKAKLGITTSSQDASIEAAMTAAVASLDPSTGGWLGRALRPQTWELRLPDFPYCSEEIRLPYPTLTSVVSVKYDDAAGDEQTLVANTDYIVLGTNGFSYGSIAPAYNKTWPSARCAPEAVRIRYICGYAPETDDSPPVPDQMPAVIPQAIALMVRSFLSNAARDQLVTRDRVEGIGEKEYSVVTKEALEAMTSVVENMLFTYQPIAI